MSKTPVLIGNVVGQTVAMLISPLFNGTGIKEKYFDGYRRLSAVFPDANLARLIADQLGKDVKDRVLCETLYLIRTLVYRADEGSAIADFSGIEYLGNLEVFRVSGHTKMEQVPEQLRSLPSLRVVECSGGRLRAIPAWIFTLPRLEKLNFSEQKITDITSLIQRARRLKMLNLSHNQLDVLPEAIGRLKYLNVLDVHANPLRKLPHDVAYLTQLTHLDISDTQISHLPVSLAFLDTLKSLNITNTNITQLDFLLQRRGRDNLRIQGERRDMEVRAYIKHEYEDDRHLSPCALVTTSALSLLAIGAGVKYLKEKKLKGEDEAK
jgi:Leucine-rich repeat (LRR) protein